MQALMAQLLASSPRCGWEAVVGTLGVLLQHDPQLLDARIDGQLPEELALSLYHDDISDAEAKANLYEVYRHLQQLK